MKKQPKSRIPTHAKKVFEGTIFSVWQWEQKLYDGSTAIFEGITRADQAYVIGVLDDQKILLVQDEQPDRGPVITPAGGRVEPREKPKEAARREMREETGYDISELTVWMSYSPATKAEWMIHAFIGRGLKRVAEPMMEPGERITPLLYTFEEFLELGHNENLRDPWLRIQLLEAKFDAQKRAALKKVLYG